MHGLSLIEVLVTMLVLAIGLLGAMALQARLQQSDVEAYQRAQALMLLEDMANRIATNRGKADDYVTGVGSPLGSGVDCAALTTASQAQRDSRDWCLALLGASEKQSTASVGAMIGGRGCVESLGGNSYRVTVAWQGVTPLSAPPSGIACGANQYNGTACSNDLCRRVVTTTITVANLK